MTARPLKLFITGGEISGDLLGSQLMRALRALYAGPLTFRGVGGETMAREGLSSLFPIDDISVMGLVDILPRARTLLQRIDWTAREAASFKPDVAVLIDVPGFNHRVAIRLRRYAPDIPIVMYVAPQVWAWRPGRARNMLRYVDHVLALLPFEPPFFERVGLKCTFVGHPVVERFPGLGLGEAFRARHDIAPDARVLTVLPGSRTKEVTRLLPVFRDALDLLRQKHPTLMAVVPTVPHVEDQVRAGAETFPVRTIVSADPDEKYGAFEASEAAIAASGTVALELALARLPAVIAYKMDALTAFYVRRAITVDYVCLSNLIANEPLLPELLQENCTAERIAAETDLLLSNAAARARQLHGLDQVRTALGLGGEAPSMRAARAVLEIIAQRATP